MKILKSRNCQIITSDTKNKPKTSLKIAGELISKLKLAGIYDNSMIIITGDHGLNGEIISEGVPLILYKPFYANDTLKISDAPVSLSDYPITVTTALNLSSNFTGISMQDRQESDTRQRLFYYYSWENEYWSHAYLPPMQEYIITNFSWSDDSWQLTYQDYYPNEVRVSSPPKYHMGAKVYFGQDQKSSDKYLNWGWSNPEKSYVWSNGNTARIVFLMNNTDSDLRLHLALTPFVIENKQGKQRVLIDLNHHEIANLSLDQNRLSDEEIVMSHEYLNESLQCITFYLPDARSPSDFGLSSDYRNLAIALTSFNISQDVENQILYGEGWYPPENWSGTDTRWMNSHATLVFYSDESRMGTINMQIVSFSSPRKLEIFTTDQRELQVTVPTYFVTAVMPVDIHKGKNILHFNTSVDCKIPVIIPELNSNDTRCLSVAVQNITIS